MSEIHKNNTPEKRNYFFLSRALGLLFLIIAGAMSFILLNLFLNQKEIDSSNFYHVLINNPQGHKDRGFNQQAIEGVCLVNNISASKCNGFSSQVKNILSYSYPGSIGNTGVIYKHLMYIYRVQNKKNFILPGFTYSNLLFDYVHDLEKLGINLIAIDTYWGGSKWPTNLWQFSFKHYYAGYQAGLYAGAYALLNSDEFKDDDLSVPGKVIKFASLGGLAIVPIYNYALGFKLGLQIINQNRNSFTKEDVQVQHVAYESIGGFSPLVDGPSTTVIADRLFKAGVSAIFNIAVSLGPNLLTSVRKAVKRSKFKHYMIGVDVDQGITIENEADNEVDSDSKILTSATIKINEGIKDIIGRIRQKETPQGSISYRGHKFSTIPERFKNTPTWEKVSEVLKTKKDLNQITSIEKEIPQLIENLITAIYAKNSEEKTYLHSVSERLLELDKLLGSQEDLITKMKTLLNFAQETETET